MDRRHRRRFAAERLEPRVLLNGAHDPALVQAVQAGLSTSNVNGLSAWASKLSDPSALGQELAVIANNLASHYNIQNVLNPILSRLNSTYTTITDLQNALEGAAGLGDGLTVNALRNLTDNFEFDLEFKSTQNISVPLPTGKDAQGPDNFPFNIPFDLGGSLQLSATLDMQATVGAYWDSGANQAVFYVYAPSTHMSVQASVSAVNLNATAHLGFMDVSITNGQVSFAPQFTMSMNDPNPGTDNGRVTLAVLNSTPVSSLIQTNVTGGAPSLSATLSTSLLPGTFPVSFSWGSINSAEQITNNLSSFANFDSLVNLDPSKVSGGLDTMVSLLATEASNAASGSKLLNTPLPLVNKSLSQIINVPQFLNNTLTRYTDVTSNSSGSTIPFSTAGQLVTLLQNLPGVGAGNISEVLNGTDLQFHLHMGGSISQSYPLNLSLGSNLNLANLSTNGQIAANLSTTTDVTFGLDTGTGNFYMLSSAQAGKPLFTATANVNTTINADASLGFLGVHITNGTASLSNAGVTVNLTDPNTSNSTGIITSDELTTTNIPSLLSAAVTGSASLSLPLSTTLASLSSSSGTLSASWSNITDPSTLSVDTSQIQSLFNFNSITPQMVLQGLASIPGFLNSLAGSLGLGKNLAFIGSNLSNVISLGNQFQNYLNSLGSITTVQGLQQRLQSLVGNAVTVNVTGSNIQFGLQFQQTLNNSISYQLNTNKNLSSGGSSNSPVSFALGGSLNVTGSVQANLGFGLSFGATPQFYLVPGSASSFSANLSIHATNINASGTLAFITVGIQNGTATVSSKESQTAPATLGLQLQDVHGNGMITLSDLTSNLAGVLGPLTVDGAVSVILPITGLPAPGSNPQLVLTWSDISDLSSLSVTPQGLGDLSSVLNFNASTILAGIQALLNMLQGWKNNPILNTNIPLINQPVSALFPWADKAIAFFQQVNSQGNTSTPAAFDTVVNNALSAAGLSQLATLTDKSSNPSAGLFDFLLKFNYSPTITPLSFKFGAGTPLNLSLSLQPSLQFLANLEFGFNPTDGFFLVDQGSGAGPEVQLNASLNVPVTALGTFGPISMGVYNGNATINFGASVDLKSLGSGTKISATQLAQNLTSVVVPSLTGNAHLTLPLGFYIGGGSPTDPGDGPGVYTTFTTSWDASNPGTFLFGSGNSTDPTQGFSDIYLDPGQFVKSIIQPVVQNIQKYDPIPKQLVDFLNNPLPLINKSPAQILGDLSGYPIGTLVNIVQTVQTVANDLAALPGQGSTGIDLSQFFGSTGALTPAASDPNATNAHSGSTPGILQPIVNDLQKVFINVPILSDPAGTIIKLLMGQNVTLVDFNPGHVELDIPFSTPEITIPIFSIGIADADVTAQIGGSVGVFANIDIGLDTRGLINQQISPANGGPGVNFPKILDGFYIGDTDRFQFGFTGSVYLNLGGQVSVFGFPIVNVYGQIGLKLDLGAHINDVAYQSGTSNPLPFPNAEVDYGKPGGDGKVHLDELYYLWNTYGALCTIDPGGTLSLIGGIGFKALCLPSFFGGDICVLDLFYPMPSQPLINYNYPCDFQVGNLAQIVGHSLVMNPDASTSDKQISVSIINDSNNKPELQIVESDGGTGLTYQDFYLSDLSAAGVNTLDVVGNAGNDTFNINPNTFQDPATGANPLQYLQINTGNGNNKIDLSGFKGTSGLHLLGTTITGGNGNDTISGTPGPNFVGVGNGANIITLLDGNDTVTAGGGNNTINLGNGSDSVTAGDGNNLISGGSGNDVFHVGNGQNTVNASGGNDTFTAGDGGDQIYNSGGNNVVTTGAGADIIRIDGNGNNSIISGAGNDQVNVGGSGNNTVYGGTGDDGIFVGDGANFVYGQDGNDRIIAGNGNNNLDGGTGNDYITAGNGNNTIIDGPSLPGGSATDNNTVVAGDGNNTVFGAWGNDQVTLGNGNDIVYLQNGNNTVLSGGGKDYITAGNGNNILNSGNGDNRIIAGNGNNQVTTGTGQDVIQLGSGNNTVSSGAGDDSISVGPGANNIDGGAGNDVLSVSGSNSYVLTNNSLTAAGGAGTLANVERISLTGANANNTFDVSGWTHGGVILNGAGPLNTVISTDQAAFALSDSNLTRSDGGSFALNNITQAQLTGANSTAISGSPYDTNFDVSYFTGHATLTGGSGPEDYNTVVSSTPGAYTLSDTSLTKTGGGTFALANINHASLPGGTGSSVNSSGFSGVLTLNGGTSTGPTQPTGGDSTGPWSEFEQSASNAGVSNSPKSAIEAAVAASLNGQFIAWADNRSGHYQIYVAEHTAGAWVQLAGSAQAGGISNTAGDSRRPAITVDAAGNPIVAWTVFTGTSTDIELAKYDPTANSNAGGWVALATSLGAGGISQTGAADNAQIAMTSSGPVVAWLDTSSGGVANVFAKEFNGTSWVTLGGAAKVTSSAQAVPAFSLAASGTNVAVAWTQAVSSATQIYLLQSSAGGAWGQVNSSASVNGLSNSGGNATQPSVAYHGGFLYVAWQDTTNGQSNVAAASNSGGTWSRLVIDTPPSAGNLVTRGAASTPKLAENGGVLTLLWAENRIPGQVAQSTELFANRYVAGAFAQVLPGQAAFGGVDQTSVALSSLSLAADPNGHPFVAWGDESSGSPQVYLRGDQFDRNVYYVAPTTRNTDDTLTTAPGSATNSGLSPSSPLDSVQSVFSKYTPGPGDAIVVDSGTYGGFTVPAADRGFVILGNADVLPTFSSQVTLNGSQNVILQDLNFSGGLSLTNETNDEIVYDAGGGYTLTGGSGVRIEHGNFGSLTLDGPTNAAILNNTISGQVSIPASVGGATGLLMTGNRIGGGLAIDNPASGTISTNDISAAGTVLDLSATFTGSIDHNNIHGGSIGVNYATGELLNANSIYGNATGIKDTVNSTTTGLGFVAGSIGNNIYNNTTGVQLTGTMVLQHVYSNVTGVAGSGVLGGTDFTTQNVIETNGVGVNFAGTILYNRIDRNLTGILATNVDVIIHNLIYRNVNYGVQTAGAADVRIVNNTFYSTSGNNIQIDGGSSNVQVLNNILWATGGYDLYLADNSHTGFFSDYNDLYTTGTGKIVHYFMDFTDILDWQQDVYQFDLHSFGTTVVNPAWAQPKFANLAADNYQINDLVSSQRASSPTIDSGDPITDVGLPSTQINLLANPGFESGITGWTASPHGATGSSNPTPFTGAADFVAPGDAAAFVTQTINLAAAGVNTSTLQNDVVLFGGRIRWNTNQAGDTAFVQITFLDSGGNPIGSPVVAQASNTTTRWELVGSRQNIPAGTQSIRFRIEADRASGTNDAAFDGAFLSIVPSAYGPDQGAYGDTLTPPDAANSVTHIALRWPDLYTNWDLGAPHTILWESFNNASQLPVKIDLYQNGVFLLNITPSTPDNGQFSWIPQYSGLSAGTFGLSIHVSLVGQPQVSDASTETFAIPQAGTNFYVNVTTDSGGDYTTAAGNNRNTGKLPSAPLPLLSNTLRTFALGVGDTVYVDTGTYNDFVPIVIDGARDASVTITGPTNTAHVASLSRNFVASAGPVIEVNDGATAVQIAHFTLVGSQHGIWVHGGSTRFQTGYITTSNNSLEGVRLESDAVTSSLDHVNVSYSGNNADGIYVGSSSTTISNSTSTNNTGNGITASGSADSITNSLASNNHLNGLNVSGSGETVSGNTVYSNTGTGIVLNGNNAISSLSGNTVYQNNVGINATVTAIANNTVYSNSTIGIMLGTGSATRNTVYSNPFGLMVNGGTATANILHDNTSAGILMYAGTVSGNQIYSNPIGIQVGYNYANNTGYYGGGGGGTVQNNVIYAASNYGILAYTSGLSILSNTIYQTAGDAVHVAANSSNLVIDNNILWSTSGYDIYVPSTSQSGFASDYNDLYTTGTGEVANWQGADYPTWASWYRQLGFDAHGMAADPQFNNLAANDFRLKSTSPGIDAGDLTSYYLQEPLANGGRINLGAYGNTPLATNSSAQEIQILQPKNLDQVSVGTSTTVNWRSSGLTTSYPIALMDAGGPTSDNFLADAFQSANYSTTSTSHAIDTSLVANPAPQQVYQTLDYTGGSVGNELSYQLPVPDGTYSISLEFAEPNAIAIGTRTFNILLNGNTVATNYDVFKQAGGQYKAIEATFPVTASGGGGIHVELVTSDTNGWPAILNGLKLSAANPLGVANPKVDLQLSTDGGTTWNTIASSLTMDPYGRGSYTWTPTAQQASANALLKVVSDDFANISGTSASFSVGSGNDYYVSPTGSNANDGRSLATPMQSLAALLAAYPAIGTGATVHVASGTYTLASNILLDQNHSGLTILGPADQSAILNRGNTATNSYVFQLQNAANITLQDLTVTGGAGGIYTVTPSGGSGSPGLQVLNCLIYGNTGEGIYVDTYSPNATISGNTVYGHTTSPNYQATDIEVDSANSTIRSNTVHDATNYGIYSSNAPALQVLNNTIYNSNYGISIGGNGASPTTISGNIAYNNSYGINASNAKVTGNTVYNNINIGLLLNGGTTASANIAYGNTYGLMENGTSATSNVLYNNSVAGLLMYNGLAQANRIYSNGTGIQVGYNYSIGNGYYGGGGGGTLLNNVVYANTTQGIFVDSGGLSILNNTIYQLTGDAVHIQNSSQNIKLDNNVLWTGGSGFDIYVASDSQTGFASDYNDLNVTGTGQVGNWQGFSFATRADWFRTLGFDAHSISADPQFVNPTGADGILGYSGGADHGADDTFTLKNTSPAIDTGDLASYYLQEPQPNGGRADMGAFGNTGQTTASPSQELQVVLPKGLDNLSAGTSVNVQWRSFGLGQSNTVALMDAGGPTSDNFLADAFQSANYSTTSTSHAIDTSLVANPAPQQVYQTLDYTGGSVGNELSYQLPVPDGTYSISLEFAEPNSIAIGTRTFNILLNGNTVATNYDVFKQAGGQYKAIEATFPVTASGGGGIHVELVTSDTNGWPAILNGLKLSAANPLGVANPKVDLQLSTDGGTTWNTIASSLTMDPYGRGSYTWTPTAQQASANALLKVVSDDFANISGTSASFSVGSGNDYYVSPTGSNANDGRSLATPMQSLAALLAAYPTIGTGATVHVASGTYNLASNVLIGPAHSGLTIIGPVDQSAVVNRGNTATNSFVFDIEGAANVTIQNLTITGGQYGIHTNLPSGPASANGSPNLSVLNCLIYGNTTEGIYVDSYSTNALISGNTVYGQTSGTNYQATGIEVDSANSTVRSNTLHDSSNYGIYSGNAPGIQVLNNTIYNSNFGINVSGNGSAPAFVSGNIVYNNSSGINASNAAINNNTIYGNTSIGIQMNGGTTASANVAYGNKYGIMANGSSATGNYLYNNTTAGLLMYNGLVSGNHIYSNPVGIQVGYNYSTNNGYYGGTGTGTIANNLIYANTLQGIWASGNALSILNNTDYALSGDAVDVVSGSVNVTIQNNIFQSAAGYDLYVASDSQTGFNSDFNDLYVTATGQVGFWQNVAYPHWADWYRTLGFDGHSISADPRFVNPAGADGILGYSGGADHGADDNFAVQSISPAIDAGSLTSYYLQEIQPNGSRIDLGAFGNTAQTTAGPARELQVVSPKGLDNLSAGTPVNVQWRSFGLGQTNTVALINMGGPTSDNFLADAFQTAGYSTTSTSHAIDTSLVANPAPQQVYQTLDYSGGSVGNELSYQLPVPDGTYSISLEFAEPNAIAIGTRTFNILLNGNTVATNYDVFKQAGGLNKAIEATFPVTASGGGGIHVELVTSDTNGWPAILNGLKLSAANPLGVANPKVDLQLSTDGGTTWNTIASSLTMDPYGRGSYTWTPTAQQASANALLKVVSDDFANISGTSASFSVGSGNDYYVSPTGSNANDGRSLATPMQSLAALLAAYPAIGTGATVHMAGGTYTLANNVFLGTSHSGLTIIGPADQSAVVNRGNTSSNSYVFQLQNVANVTIENLTITGGAGGVYTTTPSGGPGSPGLQILNCLIYGNTGDGIYVDSFSPNAVISGNTVYGHTSSPNYQATDIEVDSANSIIRGNTAHDASNYAIFSVGALGIQILNNTTFGSNFGIYVSGNGSAPPTVAGNIVYANTTGIQAGTAAINNNTVYGNANIGLLLGNYTTGSGNTAYGNKYGLVAAGISATGNVLYNNSTAGLLMYGGQVSGNRIYSNSMGVQVGYNYSNNTGYFGGAGSGILANNLIYANTTQGIWAYGNALNIINNTVFELAGDAVDVVGGSTNVTLLNNILEAVAGYDIYVASNSQSGFTSDYNDLFRGSNPDPRAQSGYWNSAAQTTLANWQAATSQDGHSMAADPIWVDPAGADNVLGYNTVTNYNGGADDNFFLGHNSPAIDAGNTWSASGADIEGYARADDPGTPNAGSPSFVESSLGSSSFNATGGTSKGWRYPYPTYWTLALPFAFPFYGASYSTVYVGSQGAIEFGGVNGLTTPNSDSVLSQYAMIAPLWTTLRTDLTGNDIFVDTSLSGQVTIRWAASNTKDNSPVNFSVTLFTDGSIQFDYGSGNTNLTPTIGISSGTTTISGSYLLSSYDKQTTLTNAASLKYSFQPGIVDLGAYEFRGNSNNKVLPTVVSTNPAGVQSNGTASYVSQVQLTFSSAVNDIDAIAPANYQLLGAGPDGQFNTADDIIYTLSPGYVGNSTTVTLQIIGASTTSGTALPWSGQLPNGLYQITVDSNPSGTGIHDLSGLKLDGDSNGTEGGNYVRTFTVTNTGAITGKVFNDANNNGLQDTGETGIAGVTVYIDSNHNGPFDAGEVSVLTDSSGVYTFTNLAAGTYMIRQVPPAADAQTAPLGYGASVNVGGAQNAGPAFGDVPVSSVTMNMAYFLILSHNFGQPGTFATGDLNGDGTVNMADLLLETRNFGHTLAPAVGGISGKVVADTNNNGILDATETGLASVTVYIDANHNGKFDAGETSTVTGANGVYTFTGLSAGSYTVREVVPAGDAETAPAGYSGIANVVAGLTATGPNFGDVALSSVTMNLAYFTTLTRNFGKAGTFANGDVNADGTVNLADLMILTRNFGHTLASVPAPAVAAATQTATTTSAPTATATTTAARRVESVPTPLAPPAPLQPIMASDTTNPAKRRVL